MHYGLTLLTALLLLVCAPLTTSCSGGSSNNESETTTENSESSAESEEEMPSDINPLLGNIKSSISSYKTNAAQASLGDEEFFRKAKEQEKNIENAISILESMREEMTEEQLKSYESLLKAFNDVRASFISPEDKARAANLGHSYGDNNELCTYIDGKYVYFSEKEWETMPINLQGHFQKKGIVVDNHDGIRFLMSLNMEKGMYSWNEAYSKYSVHLPDINRIGGIRDWSDFTHAINTFGGDADFPYCWSRDQYQDGDCLKWKYGGWGQATSSEAKLNVRTISPIPGE
jgi:hypothetical protein